MTFRFKIFIYFIIATSLSSCSRSVNIENFINKDSSLRTFSSKTFKSFDIKPNTKNYTKFLLWCKANQTDWQQTPASYYSDASISQGDMLLSFIIRNNWVVLNYKKSNGVSKQYKKTIQKSSLDFLLYE